VNGARIAQAGQNFDGYTGVATVPEPATAMMAALAAIAIAPPLRRRCSG
jgi:hypothetical protein